ncbi:choline TMA-lyase-activating enzyme [Photobacterium kasasachensis]|uniref:choline TMA-lyase-activating enzyme n=1 Tax=Photobacterium kasasachensis TaxID=2910240 RepID=UPI003D0ADAB7
MIERKARIFNIQKYNMYDGPGIRTLIFFKGCPLRCEWCSNPESQKYHHQILYKDELCTQCRMCVEVCPTDTHYLDPVTFEHKVSDDNCIGCGMCVDACPTNALAMIGEDKSITELLDIIEEDRHFYHTGGGVTLGGGEVLAQPEAAINLLAMCKYSGINTAIETCGYAKREVIEKVAEHTDLFLYDIKHMISDEHYRYTGVHNELILDNLKWLLDNKQNVKIRFPLIKGVNDSEENLRLLVELISPYKDFKNFKGIDLLPYHKMGVHKYAQLGRKYAFDDYSRFTQEELVKVESYLKERAIPVSIIAH